MTRKEQTEFISNITADLKDSLMKKLATGAVPEEWDGHELRQWVLDYFQANYVGSSSMDKGRARYKQYKNTLIVNNLY